MLALTQLQAAARGIPLSAKVAGVVLLLAIVVSLLFWGTRPATHGESHAFVARRIRALMHDATRVVEKPNPDWTPEQHKLQAWRAVGLVRASQAMCHKDSEMLKRVSGVDDAALLKALHGIASK